jgi:hypothetical protein
MSTTDGWLAPQGLVDPVGDVPLQTPQRVAFGPSLGELVLVVARPSRSREIWVKAM